MTYMYTPLIFPFFNQKKHLAPHHQALVALDCSATALRKGRCSSALNTAANVMASPTTSLGEWSGGERLFCGFSEGF